MRLLIPIIAAVAALSGAFGIYSTTAWRSDGGFREHYLALARHAPDRLSGLIASALPSCIPDAARTLASDDEIADLTVKTYFKSGVLMAEGKTAEQSAEEFIPWILKQVEPLSTAQKEKYLKLARLNTETSILCVYTSVEASLSERIDTKASSWDLRE